MTIHFKMEAINKHFIKIQSELRPIAISACQKIIG